MALFYLIAALFSLIAALFSGWGDGMVRCHDSCSGEVMWVLPNANAGGVTRVAVAHGRGFHSSTFRHNLSRFRDCNHPTYPTKSAYVDLNSRPL